MGLLTYQLLQSLSGPNPDPANVLEMTVADTTYNFSKDGVLTSNGMYDGLVKSFGQYRSVLPFGSNRSIEEQRQRFSLRDHNHAITKIVKGEHGHELAGSTVNFKLLSRGVDYANWFTWNTGTIVDYQKQMDGSYEFEVAGIHEQLQTRVKTPILSEVQFPDVDESAQYKACPIVLGKWDSTGTNRNGLLPTYYIKNTSYQKHLIGVGRYDYAATWKVWNGDGTLLTLTTDYVRNVTTQGGNQFTLIKVTGTANSLITPFTVDCWGITDNGGTSGDVIENPALQVQQLLGHWVFNDTGNIGGYGGDYAIPAGTPIDTDSFTRVANFLDRCNATASMYIDGEMTGEDIINKFCEEHNLYAYWNNQGLLTLGHCDWATTEIYSDSWPTFIYGERGVGEKVKHQFLADLRRDEITAKLLHDANVGDFIRQVSVFDPDAAVGSKIEIDMFWSRAEI